MNRKYLKNQKGFTLTEVIVVMVIIGLLTSIGIPSYRAAKIEAERKMVETNLKLIDTAIELYIESGHWGISADAAYNPEYSELIPDYLPNPVTGPGDAKYIIEGGLSVDKSQMPRTFVITEKGIGGYGPHGIMDHPKWYADTLPWKQK